MKLPAKTTLLLLLACLPAGLAASNPGPAAKPKVSADAALQLLLAGNARFAAGGLLHPDQSVGRRTDLARGQTPFAIILTCADSRVAPEIYFDQGLGDIFVLRNAGNVLNDHTIGSIEYAVEHLGAALIMVIGHSKCGAVSAAAAGGHAPGHIQSIVESITPAVKSSAEETGDKVENAVRANARMVAAALRTSDPILSEAAKHGHVKVVAARYDLSSGKVEVFDDTKGPVHATVAHAAPAAAAH